MDSIGGPASAKHVCHDQLFSTPPPGAGLPRLPGTVCLYMYTLMAAPVRHQLPAAASAPFARSSNRSGIKCKHLLCSNNLQQQCLHRTPAPVYNPSLIQPRPSLRTRGYVYSCWRLEQTHSRHPTHQGSYPGAVHMHVSPICAAPQSQVCTSALTQWQAHPVHPTGLTTAQQVSRRPMWQCCPLILQ